MHIHLAKYFCILQIYSIYIIIIVQIRIFCNAKTRLSGKVI